MDKRILVSILVGILLQFILPSGNEIFFGLSFYKVTYAVVSIENKTCKYF